MRRAEQFICALDRDEDGQIREIEIRVEDLEQDGRAISVNGERAGTLGGPLYDILREGGVTGRRWAGGRAIELDQTTGAQAWLLLKATKPLRRADRIDEVSHGVAVMSREEASYWYAKSWQPRGLRALRLLLSDEGRRRR